MDRSMNCRIEWSEFSGKDWNAHLQKVPRANLLQSYDYAAAMAQHHRQTLRTGLIIIDDAPAGLLLVLQSRLCGGFIQTTLIDRAPLWFENYGTPDHFAALLKILRHEFPRKFGHWLRFIPEIEDQEELREILKRHNFRKISKASYATIWLDLTQDEAHLRAGLDGKWRGWLNKAERRMAEAGDVTIEWDESGAHFAWLMQVYAADKGAKGYSGPSVETMQILHRRFLAGGQALLGRVLKGDEPAGAILLFCHGRSATYQIGWNGQIGRDLGAHHLLLWGALQRLKSKNIESLDLGGIHEEMAQGLTKFKQSMGGQLVRFPGLFG